MLYVFLVFQKRFASTMAVYLCKYIYIYIHTYISTMNILQYNYTICTQSKFNLSRYSNLQGAFDADPPYFCMDPSESKVMVPQCTVPSLIWLQ